MPQPNLEVCSARLTLVIFTTISWFGSPAVTQLQ
jgi:hypothetical protein